MAQLVVEDLGDEAEARLRERARRRGLSVEEETREILRDAVRGEGGPEMGLGSRIAARFRGIGLTEEEARRIEELRRGGTIRPVSFEE